MAKRGWKIADLGKPPKKRYRAVLHKESVKVEEDLKEDLQKIRALKTEMKHVKTELAKIEKKADIASEKRLALHAIETAINDTKTLCLVPRSSLPFIMEQKSTIENYHVKVLHENCTLKLLRTRAQDDADEDEDGEDVCEAQWTNKIRHYPYTCAHGLEDVQTTGLFVRDERVPQEYQATLHDWVSADYSDDAEPSSATLCICGVTYGYIEAPVCVVTVLSNWLEVETAMVKVAERAEEAE